MHQRPVSCLILPPNVGTVFTKLRQVWSSYSKGEFPNLSHTRGEACTTDFKDKWITMDGRAQP